MAGLIPGKQTTRFGALWDGDDGGAAGGDDLGDIGPAIGPAEAAAISEQADAAAANAAAEGVAGGTGIGGTATAAEAAGGAIGGGIGAPDIGFMGRGILGLPDPLSFIDPTPHSLMMSLALAPLGPLGTAIGLGINAAQALGLEGTTETADQAVATQEAATNDAGGDVGAFPFIQPPPSIATPQAAQAVLPPIAPPVPAMQGPRNFRSPASPALDPALLAAFQQRLARISGV